MSFKYKKNKTTERLINPKMEPTFSCQDSWIQPQNKPHLQLFKSTLKTKNGKGWELFPMKMFPMQPKQFTILEFVISIRLLQFWESWESWTIRKLKYWCSVRFTWVRTILSWPLKSWRKCSRSLTWLSQLKKIPNNSRKECTWWWEVLLRQSLKTKITNSLKAWLTILATFWARTLMFRDSTLTWSYCWAKENSKPR